MTQRLLCIPLTELIDLSTRKKKTITRGICKAFSAVPHFPPQKMMGDDYYTVEIVIE